MTEQQDDSGFWVEFMVDEREKKTFEIFLPPGYSCIRFVCETSEDVDLLRAALKKVKGAIVMRGPI